MHESVGTLRFHGFGFIAFCVENGEFEFGTRFALAVGRGNEEKIERQVLLGFFVEALGIKP